MTTTETCYYAIRDPHDPSIFSYWRQGPRGLNAWPAKARYEPVFYIRDRPTDRAAAEAWQDAASAQLRAYRVAVREAIAADPVTARARLLRSVVAAVSAAGC